MRTLALLLAVAFAVPAVAQGPAAFSRLGMGARAIALGGQVADLSGDAPPYLNAALAPFQAGQAVEISAGVVHAGVGNIDGRDASGFPTETYQTDEYAFFVAFGIRVSERISGGVGLRLYQSDVFDGVAPPTALGVQLGLAARLSPRLSVGLVADDLFARYQWNAGGAVLGAGAATDPFPRRFTAGAAYSLGALPSGRSRGAVTADVELATLAQDVTLPDGTQLFGATIGGDTREVEATRAEVRARVGAEVWLADIFGVRAGVDRIGAGGLDELRPAAGFALRQRFTELDARIDYTAALEPYGTGILHMATVRLGL